ncbi:unnamed protein product [Mytilus coruscus]|uniref:C1q domain-containing protein n=1 Tax=Mytilus coruscus TaxID=42192 RepID=A0A6J8CJT8_MYTCO|nr:unnamed protein product [Mytilus coruscus]
MNIQQEKQILSNIKSIEIQEKKIKRSDDDFRRLRRELKHMKKKCKPFSNFPAYKEPQQTINSFVAKESTIGQRQSKLSQRPLQLNLSQFSNESPIQTKRSSTTPQFFTAENSHNIYPLPNQIVRFDHVVTNVGQGYNPTNGIFTVDSNGVYVFHLQIRSTNKKCLVEIMKAGSRLVSTWSGLGDHLSDSTMVILHLENGDKVWIEDTSYRSYDCGIDDLSSFSGFLLRSDA